MYIYPVLNCQTAEEVASRLEIARQFLPFQSWVHLDIADGVFTFHRTWNEPLAWAAFNAPFNLEVHLMVENPEREIVRWQEAGAKRAIVHYESLEHQLNRATPKPPEARIEEVLDAAVKARCEAFLAVNPETPVAGIEGHFTRFPGAQMLAVYPGLSGQPFQPVVLEKIKWLRERGYRGTIEVDGGIVPETAKRVKAAGADIAVSASYIFHSADPKHAYEKLIAAAQ